MFASNRSLTNKQIVETRHSMPSDQSTNTDGMYVTVAQSFQTTLNAITEAFCFFFAFIFIIAVIASLVVYYIKTNYIISAVASI